MNCQELHQNIANLKAKLENFNSSLGDLNESGEGYVSVRTELKNTLASRDAVLENYLGDFIDKNPELSRDGYEFSEKIPGLKKSIHTMAPLSDNAILIGEYESKAKVFYVDEDTQKYNIKNIPKLKDIHIESSTLTPDGDLLISGEENLLRKIKLVHFDKTTKEYDIKDVPEFDDIKFRASTLLPDGLIFATNFSGSKAKALHFNKITQKYDIEEIPSDGEYIYTSAPLPQNDIFIGGWGARIMHCDKNTHEYNIERLTDINDIVTTSLFLPNGSLLIGGFDDRRESEHASIRILHFDEVNQKYSLEEIARFDGDVHTSALLSDGSIFIGGYKAIILRFNEDTKKYDIEEIPEFEDWIFNSAPLGNDNILVGGEKGELRILNKVPGNTLARLKQAIPEIIAKGASQ